MIIKYISYQLAISPTGEYEPPLAEQLNTLREQFIHEIGDRPTSEIVGPLESKGALLISKDEVWFRVPEFQFPDSLQGYKFALGY